MPSPTKRKGLEALREKGLTPRGLSLAEAAAYCGMTAADFRKAVAAGRLPRPTGIGGSQRKIWDRHALDAALDGGRPKADERDPIMDLIEGD